VRAAAPERFIGSVAGGTVYDAPMLLAPGDVIDARYRVSSLLGSESSGDVYRAFDQRLRRTIALKVLKGERAPDSMERLAREARLSASLTHPNILAVYDVGEHQGLPFIAMELVDGRPLQHHFREPAPLDERVRWLADIARALAAAHRIGLVHGDVNAQNVLVTSAGAKLCDFGCANGVGSDPRSDQYAWGLLAYELLTSRAPRRPTPARIVGHGIPPHIAEAIERALAERDDRHPAMEDIVEALERRASFSAHEQTTTRMSSLPARGLRAPKPAILKSFVDAVRAELAVGVPLGFFKAVVSIAVEGPSAFVSVSLVALDGSAELWALAPSLDLKREAEALIADDAADGNAGWRWLVLRLSPEEVSVAEIL
jgi:predicted Ser/Thr protein kinase